MVIPYPHHSVPSSRHCDTLCKLDTTTRHTIGIQAKDFALTTSAWVEAHSRRCVVCTTSNINRHPTMVHVNKQTINRDGHATPQANWRGKQVDVGKVGQGGGTRLAHHPQSQVHRWVAGRQFLILLWRDQHLDDVLPVLPRRMQPLFGCSAVLATAKS